MPPRASTLIALTIATLYTLAGQAHFTALLTAALAAQVDDMTPYSWALYGEPLGLSYETTKYIFGAFDLGAAALLWRGQTRKAGLSAAVLGFGAGWYAQLRAGAEVGQISAFLALAVVGRVLVAWGW